MAPNQRRWLIAGIALLLIVVGLGLARYLRVKPHVVTLLDLIPRFQDVAASGADLSIWNVERLRDLRDDLGHLEEALRGIQAELPLLLSLCPHLGWLPAVGPEISAAPSLLSLGIELASAGWWGLLGTEPLLQEFWPLPDELETHLIPSAILTELAESRRYLLEAHDAVERAMAARAEFTLDGMDPRIAGPLERLNPYLPMLHLGIRGVLLAPEFMGAEGRRNYILLAQNSHELRPTGGLISGIGVLSTEGGQIQSLELVDSYAFDRFQIHAHPPAPPPLAKYMWAGVLALRDANWSPDFPTSAEVIAGLYQLGRPDTPIDGVVATDLRAVELLLKALGPMELEGYGESVTADNVIRLLQQYWAAPVGAGTIEEQKSSDWWSHRKDIMGDLVEAAIRKAQQDPLSLDLPTLVSAVAEAMDGKHVLLHSRDAATARLLADFGWNGALADWQGDYLMVVDANLGFNKVDASIQRRMEYSVHLDQNPESEVTLTYENKSPATDEICRHQDLFGRTEYQASSYEDLMRGCYWNYMRLYVPAGSELLSVQGTTERVDVSREMGKRVYGTFLLVPPGETRQLQFRFTLSTSLREKIAEGEYRLLVQKQPGLDRVPLRVKLGLPTGISPQEGHPLLLPSSEGWQWDTDLETDRQVDLALIHTPDKGLALGLVLGALFLGAGMMLRLLPSAKSQPGHTDSESEVIE